MTEAPTIPAVVAARLVPEWRCAPRVRAFFTTRAGGVSAGPYASLNLGAGRPHAPRRDDPRAVAENRRRLEAHLPGPPAWLDQVHGNRVATIAAPAATPPVADAAVTCAAGVPLAVLVADCLPVLLAQREGDVIGIAHAGWRGLAAGVVERTVAAMDCPPGSIVAWLGPAIGPSAFEVGADVRDAFVADDAGAAAAFRPTGPGKWHADLPALARRRLAAAGVAAVHGGTWCTVSDPVRFFSYRRDGETGRMAALLWLEPAG